MPKENKQTESTETVTTETAAFVRALQSEFDAQATRYHSLTGHLLEIEARVELAEKQLCLTRDHLTMVIEKTDGIVLPDSWAETLKRVRFVGVRLADACVALIREHKRLTPKDLLTYLDKGMFRFRTSTPYREIHGALLRQRNVKREDEAWVWNGPDEDQLKLTLLKLEKAEKKKA
jgi:hypothetical protein